MTTAVQQTSRKITVAAVRTVLQSVVAEHPGRSDRRAHDMLPARYIDRGQPNCLVAIVLSRLGYSVGVLRALDQEHSTGDLVSPGVRVGETRHPALRKLTPNARLLLDYVQRQQDRGRVWDTIIADAFAPSGWMSRRFDEARKPWMYSEN